jgi:hypothetical protein
MPKTKKRKKKNPKRVAAGKRVGKKSKAKGDNLERWIAQQLETRYGNPKAKLKDREFQRTPLSGGMKRSYPGDVLVPDWFPFMIEAKCRRDLDLACAFPKIIEQGSDNPVLKIWESEKQKVLPGTTLLLVIKHYGYDPVAVMSTHIYDQLDCTDKNPRTWPRASFVLPGLNLTAVTFGDLFRLSKEALIRLRSTLDPGFVAS